jgi:hypothetical protein
MPIASGFLLWLLMYLLFRDDMEWRACVIWITVSEAIGVIFAFLAAKFILGIPTLGELFAFDRPPEDFLKLAIAGIIGTMLSIYSVIWYRQGKIPFDKAVLLFLIVGGSWIVGVWL